jgi:NAD(P)-dependent dehydrogenase (short-subunit alcohol dehydrogenase family)
MKNILLIGASGGVGQAVARKLLEHGYDAWGSVVDERDLELTRRNLPAQTNLFVANFSDADKGKASIENALAQSNGPLAAAIGCAGINPYGPLETTSLAVFRHTMEINALANLAVYQAAMPHLRKNQGRFIFLSSFSGKVGTPLLGHYVASKHALEGLADVMRLEAGQWGINISLIEPGAIKTPMLDTFYQGLDARLQSMSDAERRNYGPYIDQHKLFATAATDAFLAPEEVAAVVMDALESAEPQPRYAIGNAVPLLAKRKELSDQAMDALWREMMPGIAAKTRS